LQLVHSLIVNEGFGHWRIGKALFCKKGGIASIGATIGPNTGPEKAKTWNYWNGEKWISTSNWLDSVTISLIGMYYIDLVSIISR
jgi:hypothetical protein